jgi:hypothetical protein
MENKTDLDALDRAHAMYSTKRCELTWDERYLADNWPADIHNAYPAIAAELREARQEIAELRAELNERTMIAARAQESLRLAMAGVADRGAVWAAYGNADSARSWLDARDRRMKALGAAAEVRRLAEEDCDTVFPGDLPHITQNLLLERAAELEAAAGEGEGNG